MEYNGVRSGRGDTKCLIFMERETGVEPATNIAFLSGLFLAIEFSQFHSEPPSDASRCSNGVHRIGEMGRISNRRMIEKM
jgi:hypothetical protein